MRFNPLLVICLSATLAGAEPAGDSAPKFAVDLAAGSRLIGTPAARTLPLKTEFAQMDIPLNKIASLTKKAGDPAVMLTLRNGDKLSGALQLKELDLTTILGKLILPVEQIIRLASVEKPAEAVAPDPEKVAATRHACLNNMRIIDAGKEQYALDHNNAAPGSLADLVGPQAYIRQMPVCPAGGKYNMNGLGTPPTCSAHGSLP